MIALAVVSAASAIIVCRRPHCALPSLVMLVSMVLAVLTVHRADVMLILAAVQIAAAPLAVLRRRGSSSLTDIHRALGLVAMAWVFVASASHGTKPLASTAHAHLASPVDAVTVAAAAGYLLLSLGLVWRAVRNSVQTRASRTRQVEVLHVVDIAAMLGCIAAMLAM